MGAQASDPLGVSGIVLDGKFVVEGPIGEGGSAVVYRGQHTTVGGPVAIKFLTTLGHVPEHERGAVFEEFLREGRLVSELSARSSAIVQPRDMGMLERPGEVPLPYLVLEWLDGRTLDEVLVGETNSGKQPRTLADACQLLEPVVGALALAHERGIAHRDVKPENIFVVERAQAPGARIKLLDFGVAKIMRRRMAGVHQTGTVPTAFTPHYGAPEQFSRTYGETGAWSDVFAMALVILEVMRGGRRALQGDDYVELGGQSCAEDRRPTPRSLKMSVSDDVEAVFSRALAVQPMHRYQSMGAFWSALLGAVNPSSTGFPLSGPSAAAAARMQSAPPPAAARPASKPGAGKKIIVLAAAVGALMIAAASVIAATRIAAKSQHEPSAMVGSAAAPSAERPSGVLSAAPVASSAAVLCPAGTVTVSGGRFKVGADGGTRPDDGPRHGVFIDTFCLDRSEATAADYEACMNAGSCSAPSIEGIRGPADRCTNGRPDASSHPANCLTFDQATTFCAFRGMRLPTESEWEVAATRGGELPWEGAGAEAERANLDHNDGVELTAPVGSFPRGATKDGIMDLIGNVAEWQADWFAAYPSTDLVNPRGPATGTKRVVRGGAWSGLTLGARPPGAPLTVTHRDALAPEERSASVGVRCARDLER